MDPAQMSAAIDEIAAFAKERLGANAVGGGPPSTPGAPTSPIMADAVSEDDTLATKESGEPCRVMTVRHKANLKQAFEMFDEDDSGELSQGEIIKLLLRLSVVGNQADAIKVMQEIDVNNDGSIDLREFLDGMDKIADEGHYIHADDFRKQMNKKLKLGFGGTSWLDHASITWMMNGGVVIITTGVLLSGLIYFRFILVPITMAYFLTFLLGPLMDYIYQRPLVTRCSRNKEHPQVCCMVKHMDEVQAQAMWDEKHPDEPLPTKGNGKPDYDHPDYPIESRWHNPLPWREDETPWKCEHCAGFQIALHEIGCLQRMPWSVALLVALMVAVAAVGLPLYGCAMEIQALTQQEEFMGNLTQLRDDIRGTLLDEGYVIMDLEPELVVTNTTLTFADIMSSSEPATKAYARAADMIVNFINDTILTLLLMLMMLGTREGRTPEQVERERTNPHSMSVMERIEASIRNYILLKTVLSCVTAIGVAFFMGITGVKMPMVWAVLAFIFNFIPNVGSMLATIMPLPIILVDSELTMAWKVLGFALPAVWNAYIGNVLEPTLFGKSLNLTAISVFIGLVLWASLWGIPGAILSVPLLGAQKILLDAADYPLAKRMLHLMREDNSVEELIEARGFEGTEAFVKAHMEALDTVSKPHSVVHQHDHDLEQPHGNHASPYDWTKQSDGSYDRVGSHPMPGHTPAPGLGSAGGVTQNPVAAGSDGGGGLPAEEPLRQRGAAPSPPSRSFMGRGDSWGPGAAEQPQQEGSRGSSDVHGTYMV